MIHHGRSIGIYEVITLEICHSGQEVAVPAHETFNRLRILAGVLLIVSLFLPLYVVPTSLSGGYQANYVWDIARGDLAGVFLLMFAFAMPAAIIVLHRVRLPGIASVALMISEPLVLGMSATILLTLASSAFSMLPLFGPWLLMPASSTISAGAWMALSAECVLLLLWAATVGRQLRNSVAGTATA